MCELCNVESAPVSVCGYCHAPLCPSEDQQDISDKPIEWLSGFALTYVGDSLHTNRKQFHVRCNECGEVVHHCTTGPSLKMRDHREEMCNPSHIEAEQMIPFHRNQLGHLLVGEVLDDLVCEVAHKIGEPGDMGVRDIVQDVLDVLFYLEDK